MNFAKFLERPFYGIPPAYCFRIYTEEDKLLHIHTFSQPTLTYNAGGHSSTDSHTIIDPYIDKSSETFLLVFAVLTLKILYQLYLFYISKFSLLKYSITTGRTVSMEDCLIKTTLSKTLL